MNAPLRFNEALLITDRAFHPLQCIAWAHEGDGELSLTVIDRTSTRTLGRKRISTAAYSDPLQLAAFIQQTRQELSEVGIDLAPWRMPD
ncbi:hypothetical protein ACFOJE_09350 [Azotobacter bryophylli]|jgi:hypothetical protein|uniref:Uncharacterized protein n=1 Tax=Azotobacter bryophylli TaxID=1986537 RepID=A0ABV7AU21_9GAMM